MQKLLQQGGFFVVISGIGWLLDFGIYALLTGPFSLPVLWSNMLSSLPAVTFVFLFSTRKIFAANHGHWSLRQKYLFYLCYQAVLILC